MGLGPVPPAAGDLLLLPRHFLLIPCQTLFGGWLDLCPYSSDNTLTSIESLMGCFFRFLNRIPNGWIIPGGQAIPAVTVDS